MDFIKAEIDGEFQTLGFANQRKNLRVLKQTGRSDKERDGTRKALAPGKRISKTGNVYWETRKNRSDKTGTKI